MYISLNSLDDRLIHRRGISPHVILGDNTYSCSSARTELRVRMPLECTSFRLRTITVFQNYQSVLKNQSSIAALFTNKEKKRINRNQKTMTTGVVTSLNSQKRNLAGCYSWLIFPKRFIQCLDLLFYYNTNKATWAKLEIMPQICESPISNPLLYTCYLKEDYGVIPVAYLNYSRSSFPRACGYVRAHRCIKHTLLHTAESPTIGKLVTKSIH